MWWKHPTPSHRYDYLYNDGELQGWTDRIEEIRPHVDAIFAFTNNCRMGASIVDALRMKQLLNLDALMPAVGASGDLFQAEPEDPLAAMRQRVIEARKRDQPAIDLWRASQTSTQS